MFWVIGIKSQSIGVRHSMLSSWYLAVWILSRVALGDKRGRKSFRFLIGIGPAWEMTPMQY